MTCDLCKSDKAVEGRLLCQICFEAILRLSNAVKANAEAKPKRPDPVPELRKSGPAYFKAAANAGNGSFRHLQAQPAPLSTKPAAEEGWSENFLPDFTD